MLKAHPYFHKRLLLLLRLTFSNQRQSDLEMSMVIDDPNLNAYPFLTTSQRLILVLPLSFIRFCRSWIVK